MGLNWCVLFFLHLTNIKWLNFPVFARPRFSPLLVWGLLFSRMLKHGTQLSVCIWFQVCDESSVLWLEPERRQLWDKHLRHAVRLWRCWNPSEHGQLSIKSAHREETESVELADFWGRRLPFDPRCPTRCAWYCIHWDAGQKVGKKIKGKHWCCKCDPEYQLLMFKLQQKCWIYCKYEHFFVFIVGWLNIRVRLKLLCLILEIFLFLYHIFSVLTCHCISNPYSFTYYESLGPLKLLWKSQKSVRWASMF